MVDFTKFQYPGLINKGINRAEDPPDYTLTENISPNRIKDVLFNRNISAFGPLANCCSTYPGPHKICFFLFEV